MTTLNDKPLKRVIDPRLAKAFTHPLRGHIWVTICELGVASPKTVAEETGLDVSEVSYHFRELKRRKLITLLRTVRRRGFAEHIYEPTAPVLFFEDADWMGLPPSIRSTISGDMVSQIVEELIAALEAGSLDARDRHLSRTWLMVDEQGWGEVMEVVQEALEKMLAIHRACGKRRGKTSKPDIPVCATMACFETAASIGRQEGTVKEV